MAGFSGTYPRTAFDPAELAPTRSFFDIRVPFGRERDDMVRVVRSGLIRGPVLSSVHRSELAASRYAICSALTGQPTIPLEDVDLRLNDYYYYSLCMVTTGSKLSYSSDHVT